jgi:hypothetical protein
MFLDCELLKRDGVDLLLYLALVTAGLKEASLLDFLEQLFSPLLRGNECCPPARFGGQVGICHARRLSPSSDHVVYRDTYRLASTAA